MSKFQTQSKYLSGFNPNSLKGCALWLDAGDSNAFTFSGGSTISQWKDKSSNNYVGTAAGTPSLVSTALNGKPAVTFNGTDQYFSFGDSLDLGSNRSLFIFAVYNHANSSTAGGIVAKARSTALLGRWGLYRTTTNTTLLIDRTTVTTLTYADTGTDIRITGAGWQRDGNATLFSNAVSQASVAASNTGSNFSTADPLFVGARGDGTGTVPLTGSYFAGNISEIIVYLFETNLPMSNETRQQIEGYLAWKWNLVNLLPSTHAFKQVPLYTHAFSPIDTGKCVLWLDGNDPAGTGVPPANGSAITTWVDKSGSGSNATNATSATAPTYVASATNNLGALSFNGTSSFLNTQDFYSARTHAIFAVIERRNTVTTNKAILSGSNDVLSSNAALYFPNDSNFAYGYGGGGGLSNTFPRYFSAATEPFYLISIYTLSGTQVRVNGLTVWESTSSPNLLSCLGLRFGQYLRLANGYWQGYIGEYIVLNAATGNTISLLDVQLIEGYLGKKWGLMRDFNNFLYTSNVGILAPPALWLDAADTTTLTISGSSITQWRDKSGNGRNVTATGTITLGNINGVPATQWSGAVNTYFRGSTVSPASSALQVFAVFNMNSSSSANARVVSLATAPSTDYQSVGSVAAIARNDTTTIGWNRNTQTNGWANTVNTPIVMTFRATGSTGNMWSNTTVNTATFSGGAASFTYLNHTIGTSTGEESTTQFTGQIGEIIIFTGASALTAANISRVQTYLIDKWLIRTTPITSNHPFQRLDSTTTDFQPRQVPGCILWLDAADPSTVTLVGGTVNQVRDKSSNGFVLSNGTGFTYNQTKFQGKYPSFYSSSSTSSFFIGSNTSFSTAQPLQVFVVAQSDLPNTTTGYIYDGTSTTATQRIGWFNTGGATASTLACNAINAGSTLGRSDSSNVYIGTGAHNTTTSTIYTNGNTTSTTSGNSGTNTFVGFMFGSRFDKAQSFQGHICEVIVYSNTTLSGFHPLPIGIRRQIEGYLAWKWGIVGNLPSSNYFKTIKP